jgi:AcrR family transcriptional regulator
MTDTAATRPPGRPRSTEADEAIARATLELLAEHGYRSLSVEQVARRAGVGKATIYRRHSSKQELVAAAIRHLHHRLDVPEDTGSLAGDFAAVAAQAAASGQVTDFPTFTPRMLAEAAGDEEMREIFHRYLVQPRRDVMRAVVERAKQRGEIREDVDTEVVIDLVAGPMVYRLVLGGADIDYLREHSAKVMAAAFEGLRKR